MLTLDKQFGTIHDILKEAKRVASLTGHTTEFEFNGVIVNVASNYLSENSSSADAARVLYAVRNGDKKVYI